MEWEAKLIKYKNECRIAIYFEKNAELLARIKKLDGSKLSQSLRIWHLPDTEIYRIQFGVTLVEDAMPSAEGVAGIEKFKQYLQSKRYSENTIKT